MSCQYVLSGDAYFLLFYWLILCRLYMYSCTIIITACSCSVDGSASLQCDQMTGSCSCLTNVIGDKCDKCKPEHHGLRTGKVFPAEYVCGTVSYA